MTSLVGHKKRKSFSKTINLKTNRSFSSLSIDGSVQVLQAGKLNQFADCLKSDYNVLNETKFNLESKTEQMRTRIQATKTKASLLKRGNIAV